MNNVPENALDRLERTRQPSNEREYTLEEQLDSVSTDDFLDGMSDVAKDNLGHLFEEVTTNDTAEYDTEEIVVNNNSAEISEPTNETADANESTNDDELFNHNTEKPKRQYRKNSNRATQASQVQSDSTNVSFNPILDQLAKDVIDELRAKHYKINRFDDSSMEMIFNYMYNKF